MLLPVIMIQTQTNSWSSLDPTASLKAAVLAYSTILPHSPRHVASHLPAIHHVITIQNSDVDDYEHMTKTEMLNTLLKPDPPIARRTNENTHIASR